MKKLILLITIVFSGMLIQAQSKTGINWEITPEELLIQEDDEVLEDTSYFDESNFSFDTIDKRVITFRKVFWDEPFKKRYYFENNKLSIVDIRYYEDDFETIRVKLWDYRVYYIKMLELLISKYGEPTKSEDIDLLEMDKFFEAIDTGEHFSFSVEWNMQTEYISFYYWFDPDYDFLAWSLDYSLNSNNNKAKIKQEKKEMREKIIKEDIKRKESEGVLDDI